MRRKRALGCRSLAWLVLRLTLALACRYCLVAFHANRHAVRVEIRLCPTLGTLCHKSHLPKKNKFGICESDTLVIHHSMRRCQAPSRGPVVEGVDQPRPGGRGNELIHE